MNKQLVPKLLEANLNVLNEDVFSKFPLAERELLQSASIALVRSAEAFLDDAETPDLKQLEKIWLTFAGTNGIPYAVTKGQTQVSKIDNEVVRNLTSVLLPHVGNTLQLLTDENPDNVKQIGDYWKNALKDEKLREALMDNVIQPLIEQLIKNPILEAAIISIVRGALNKL